MEAERFLIDSNIVIYFLDGKIPENQREKVRRIFDTSFILSTVSKIELLGWHKISREDKIRMENFLSNARIVYVDEIVEQKAIDLKRSHNMETPDSIIGASALLNGCTLVTRNEDDFKKVKSLKIYNPFKT